MFDVGRSMPVGDSSKPVVGHESVRRQLSLLVVPLLFLVQAMPAAPIHYESSLIVPPVPPREFRGAWIATVRNIDWPSRPGLSTAEQQRELLALLDRAAQLKLNAVIFQVRPAGDALYASPFEPWSEYLTGTMGRPPAPFYDPLAFAVSEAHKRGLQLHAWFNPYRALHPSHTGPIAANHVSRTHPQFVRKYGDLLWLDPGEPDVRDYLLKVVMDVVKRYDIDGVQFDDYFYPDAAADGREFPDEASWHRFGARSGLSRDDWRRQNVNALIERVYRSIKAAKPWVLFGISPRGIWRPGYPAQIKGADDYAEHYADSRKWLAAGWVDYFSPQLYWPIEQKEQSFPVLLKWWSEQNTQGRHLWPGLAAWRADEWQPDEIVEQIQITRKLTGVSGYILYRLNSLPANGELAGLLKHTINTQPALVPASPWLGSVPPSRPVLTADNGARVFTSRVNWHASGNEVIRFWILQTRSSGSWTTDILPGAATGQTFHGVPPDVVSVRAMDRAGNLSAATVEAVKRQLPPAKKKIKSVRPPKWSGRN
jgi:uncharacterized lipoprotein YddW (UPF0748 family)